MAVDGRLAPGIDRLAKRPAPSGPPEALGARDTGADRVGREGRSDLFRGRAALAVLLVDVA